jgi:hypothetical protein
VHVVQFGLLSLDRLHGLARHLKAMRAPKRVEI